MIKATREEKSLVTSLLTDSFEENQSVNYIVRKDDYKSKRLLALMEYSFEMCFHYGNVWLSGDRRACGLVLYPHHKKTTLKSIWLDIQLIFNSIGLGGIKKTLNREAQIKRLQPKEKMAYLWFIGVDPVYSHQGIGSKLLLEIIEDAEKKNLPLYLETSTMRNLPWYKRFGFQLYNQLDLGYTLYFLKREPDKS